MPVDLGIIDQVLVPILLFATAAVFFGDLIANMVSFKDHFINAAVLALIAAVAVLAFGLVIDGRAINELFFPVLICAVIAFAVGYVGNVIAFGNRFLNALVTAIVFAIVSGVGLYFTAFTNP